MARPLRMQYEDALYHITARGGEKKEIYSDDRDRYVFLKVLDRAVERYAWVIYAYCLMGNHYHLLVRTPNANLSKGMRQLNGEYAQYFNKRHDRVGHLFQGRYKHILIEDENRLLTVARYVVLNPVRAGLVSRPEDWRWSSYRGTAGVTKPPPFIEPDHVLSFFSGKRETACGQYVDFVRKGIGKESPFHDVTGGVLVRDNESIGIAIARLNGEISDEVPRREYFSDRPSLEEIFIENKRDIGIYKAVNRHGYSLREIGEFVGLHYSRISKIAKEINGD